MGMGAAAAAEDNVSPPDVCNPLPEMFTRLRESMGRIKSEMDKQLLEADEAASSGKSDLL